MCRVDTGDAGKGEEAFQIINRRSPDLIFTDMRLAGMNGLELAQQLKKDFPCMRIAMLTGYDFPEYRRAASQQGVDRFFAKHSLEWKAIEEFVQSIPENNQGRQ